MKPGTLYLIPCTISDEAGLSTSIPADVAAVTASLSHFVTENAKTARKHLGLVSKTTPLKTKLQDISMSVLNVRTPKSELERLLAPLLEGKDCGLISEAGIPAVADPGADLVALAHEKNIPVRPLVGPCSLMLALMASGLNGQSFAFNGYVAVDAKARTDTLTKLEKRSRESNQTQIFIETPYRNAAFLSALCDALKPSTRVTVAFGLTGPNETVTTKSVSAWKKDISANRLPDFARVPCVFLFLA